MKQKPVAIGQVINGALNILYNNEKTLLMWIACAGHPSSPSFRIIYDSRVDCDVNIAIKEAHQ